MQLKVKSKPTTSLSESDQFDPVDLAVRGELRFSHVECAGGDIAVRIVQLSYDPGVSYAQFSCQVCGDSNREKLSAVIKAMRKLLILNKSQQVGTAEFLISGADSKT
ncbi:MAG: hypothetical protein AABY81_03055 [Pseudomonadota bacterium]